MVDRMMDDRIIFWASGALPRGEFLNHEEHNFHE